MDQTSQTNRFLPALAFDELELDSLSFIKLDIQGSELSALKGLQSTLQRHRPTILLEYEPIFDSDFKVTWSDYMNYFRFLQYEISEWINPSNFILECTNGS